MSIAEKFETIADAVYQKGYEDGAGNNTGSSYDEGYTEGYKKGRDDEYDAFWDSYQKNGGRTSYAYAFYSSRWNNEIYNPKYPILPTNSNSIFNTSYITDTKVDIDLTGAGTNTAGMFQYSKLEKISKLIVIESTGYSNCFTSCSALKKISFEGIIGKNISFSDCPNLSAESIENIIDHLKDYSGTTPTCTLTLHSSCWTRLANEGSTAPNGKDWRTYAEEKGWLTE